MTTDDMQTPAHTLDRIRDGGQQLLMVAMERLRECERAIQEGRFCDAYARSQELAGRLTPLANAEAHMGSVAATWVLRAVDVEEGMVLKAWGTVTSKEVVDLPNPGGPKHEHVRLTFEGQEDNEVLDLHAEQEVVALRHGD